MTLKTERERFPSIEIKQEIMMLQECAGNKYNRKYNLDVPGCGHSVFNYKINIFPGEIHVQGK